MKALLCSVVLLFLIGDVLAQNVYQIRADTVRIHNTCGTAELVLENSTQDTLGFLYNKGKGRTEFRRIQLQRIGASQLAIVGQDTLDLGFDKYGDTAYVSKRRTLTVTGGSGISVSPSAAQDLSANRLWTITNTGVTSVNGAIGAVTVAPASGSASYINNQAGTAQTANFWISGSGVANSPFLTNVGVGSGTASHYGLRSTGAVLRFTLGLAGIESGSTSGANFNIWRYNDEGGLVGSTLDINRSTGVVNFATIPTIAGSAVWYASNHAAGSPFTLSLPGATVLSAINTNAAGHVTQLSTRTLTAADIGAAPASTSGNYIQNQSAADQAASFRVSGTARMTGSVDIGSTSLMIRGGGDPGYGFSNIAYIRFTNSDGTTRKGYVGDASSGNSDMYLTSDSGSVRLVPQNGNSGSLNVQGTTMDYSGGQLFLNNGTANQLLFNNIGVGRPAFTVRSKGAKVILFPSTTASTVDYALGMDSNYIWNCVPQRSHIYGFRWYGGNSQIAGLDGIGNMLLAGQITAATFVQSSLRTLKEDIRPFSQSALDIIEKVQVRTFKFKEGSTGRTNIGFIADEVPDEMASPQRQGVDQTNTVALLVKAVQELTEQNKALQQEVNEMKQLLEAKNAQ